ncbi:hypothetical protein ACFSHR_17585 [Azotobacter chroococcum]
MGAIKGDFLQPTATHLDVQTPNAPYLAERKTFCVFRPLPAQAPHTWKKHPKSPRATPFGSSESDQQVIDSK